MPGILPGRDLRRIPEAYFADALPFGTTPNAAIVNQHYSLTDMPIDKLIQASLMAVWLSMGASASVRIQAGRIEFT